MTRSLRRWLGVAIGIFFLGAFAQVVILHAQPVSSQVATAVQKPGRAYVILWCDTEDYVLPESNDSAEHIAEFLTWQGVYATFTVVGEKARTLKRLHREDEIAALNKHAIVYHSNYHSWRVSPAEFEQFLGWHDGVKEFICREQPGMDSARRTFGRMPTAYGQPEYSWSPESQPAQLETAQRPVSRENPESK